jgi:hypothetical protein
MDMWEFGLFDHFIKDAFRTGNADECFAQQRKWAKNVPIKLVDLSGAFFILGIGLGLAILCFFIELVIVTKYRHEMKEIGK